MSDLEFRREMAARAEAYVRAVARDRANRRDMSLLALASAGMLYLLVIAMVSV